MLKVETAIESEVTQIDLEGVDLPQLATSISSCSPIWETINSGNSGFKYQRRCMTRLEPGSIGSC